MKRLMILVCAVFFSAIAVNKVYASGKNELCGVWKYKVSDAGYEYSSGQLIVDEKEGKMTVAVQLEDGKKVNASNFKYENGIFSFSLEIDYNNIKVTGKMVDGKIVGHVDSPDGYLSMFAEKKKPGKSK